MDFVLVTGDAYVDHPASGAAIISRLLEAEGYRVGVLSQPDFTTCESMKEFGRPRYGFFIGGGNVDSMVAHYSVAKIRRARTITSGGAAGKQPDRSATVYTQLAKQACNLPVILGGLSVASPFAPLDYWLDDVLPSIVESSGADIVSFGMGNARRRRLHGDWRPGAGGGDHRRCGDLLSDGFRRSARVLCGVRLFCQSARRQDSICQSLPHPDGQPGRCLGQARGAKTIERYWCRTSRRRRSPGGSWTPCMRFPLRGAIIPPTSAGRRACH